MLVSWNEDAYFSFWPLLAFMLFLNFALNIFFRKLERVSHAVTEEERKKHLFILFGWMNIAFT